MAEVVSRRSIIYDILFDVKEGKKDIKDAEKEIKKLDKVTSGLSTTLKGVGVAILGAFTVQKIAQFTKEAIKLAANAEGIRAAFERLGDPKLLNGLRTAVQGTVTDVKLMQAAVRAQNFKVPLDRLAGFFQFAASRARDTGESVDFLVNSIIDGIGRKSTLVLDNLGISATELQAEIKKVGDFGEAAANIIQREMDKAGDSALTAKDAFTQFDVAVENLTLAIGEDLLPALRDAAEFTTGYLNSIVEQDRAIKLAIESINFFGKSYSSVLDKNRELTEFGKTVVEGFVLIKKAADKLGISMSDLNEETGQFLIDATEMSAQQLLDEIRELEKVAGPASIELHILRKAWEALTTSVVGGAREWESSIDIIVKEIKRLDTAEEDLAEHRRQREKERQQLLAELAPKQEEPESLFDSLARQQKEDLALKKEQERQARALAQAEEDLTAAKIESVATGLELARSFAEEGSALDTALFLFQKGIAISEVLINAAAENSANAAYAATLGLAGPAYLAATSAATNIRAGANIAIITATTIPQLKFAEGTDFLTLDGNKKGKDTIPIWADEGEAIIKADSNKAYPGLARAFIDKNVEDWIGFNYDMPKLETTGTGSELTDYSGRFYNQLRATKDGNQFLRDIRNAVSQKNDYRVTKLMNKRRF